MTDAQGADLVVRPPQDGIAGQLSAIVADDGLKLAAFAKEPIERAGDPDPEIGCNRRPRREDASQAAAIGELVGDEVERPALV